MLAAARDPSQIDDEFAITIVGTVEIFLVECVRVTGVDNEWCKNQIAFLFAAIPFDKHPPIPHHAIQINFFAIPSFGIVVFKLSFDLILYDLQFYSPYSCSTLLMSSL